MLNALAASLRIGSQFFLIFDPFKISKKGDINIDLLLILISGLDIIFFFNISIKISKKS